MNKFKIAQKTPPEFLKEKTRAVSIFLCCSVDERETSDEIVYPTERAVEEAAYHFKHSHRRGYRKQHSDDYRNNNCEPHADRETYQRELTDAIGDLRLVALPYKIEHEADERQKPQQRTEEAEEKSENFPSAGAFAFLLGLLVRFRLNRCGSRQGSRLFRNIIMYWLSIFCGGLLLCRASGVALREAHRFAAIWADLESVFELFPAISAKHNITLSFLCPRRLLVARLLFELALVAFVVYYICVVELGCKARLKIGDILLLETLSFGEFLFAQIPLLRQVIEIVHALYLFFFHVCLRELI